MVDVQQPTQSRSIQINIPKFFRAIREQSLNGIEKLIDMLPIDSLAKSKMSLVLLSITNEIFNENEIWFTEWLETFDPSRKAVGSRDLSIVKGSNLVLFTPSRLMAVATLFVEIIPRTFKGANLEKGLLTVKFVKELIVLTRVVSNNTIFDEVMQYMLKYIHIMHDEFEEAIKDRDNGPPRITPEDDDANNNTDDNDGTIRSKPASAYTSDDF